MNYDMKQYNTTIQETFVINLLNEKRNGYYVELGASHSTIGSNTYLLETQFDWKGVSFEIVPEFHKEVSENRKNPCILGDALKFDYKSYFEENNFPKQIDYLQVDVDESYDKFGRPQGNRVSSLLGLIAVPLNTYRFTVITFEHDEIVDYKNAGMKDAQREILYGLGYFLVQKHPGEDIWVDTTVIPYMDLRKYILI
jgi:hypothetical protein